MHSLPLTPLPPYPANQKFQALVQFRGQIAILEYWILWLELVGDGVVGVAITFKRYVAWLVPNELSKKDSGHLITFKRHITCLVPEEFLGCWNRRQKLTSMSDNL